MALGAGLEALLGENDEGTSEDSLNIKISDIEPDKNQPRKTFSTESLQSLAESIRDHGLIQPITVRPTGDGRYKIVAGERRWRAARMLGWTEIPAFVKDMSDAEAAQIAIIENLQRDNLDPIEEAEGYKTLSETYGMSQESIAKLSGKSRSTITNSLRLLKLCKPVQDMMKNGLLSVGQAKALLMIKNPEKQTELANDAANEMLSVRDVERKAQAISDKEDGYVRFRREKSPYTKEIELSLRNHVGRKISVHEGKKTGTGQIVLEYYTDEDLENLAEKLANLGI